MSWGAKLAIALAIFVAGVMTGIKYHAGQDARAALVAADVRQADARKQRFMNDQAAGRNAARLATLETKLGDARVQIQTLTGRDCVDPRTVGLLNALNSEPVRAAAGDVAGAAAAAPADSGQRYSTDVDVAGALAICRARYGAVANQTNEILDIEERRHPELQK